jgi:membrane fusion protein, multidrug efflux system
MRNSSREAITGADEPGGARTSAESSPRVAPRHTTETGRATFEAADVSEERSRRGAPQSRWRRPLLILGPLALVLGGLGLYLATGRYVTEEDAYIQAVSASISPQVSDQVVAITAKSNTEAKKNDPVFTLDAEPYRIALANAEAQLGIARDQVHTLIETYRARLKQIDQAKATVDYAQTTFGRQQQLYNAGAAPRATLDAAP